VSSREGAPGVSPLVAAVIARYPGELGDGWAIDYATNVTQQIMNRSGIVWSAQYLSSTRNLSALHIISRAPGVGPQP
jgi:hypothetical protein